MELFPEDAHLHRWLRMARAESALPGTALRASAGWVMASGPRQV